MADITNGSSWGWLSSWASSSVNVMQAAPALAFFADLSVVSTSPALSSLTYFFLEAEDSPPPANPPEITLISPNALWAGCPLPGLPLGPCSGILLLSLCPLDWSATNPLYLPLLIRFSTNLLRSVQYSVSCP